MPPLWKMARMTHDPAADTHPLDQHRDPSHAALVRRLAAEVASRYGGDLSRMRRTNEYSNATWVGDGIAVRITHATGDMSREAALAGALPQAVVHPEILGEGTEHGHGWIVSREIHGRNLGEAWPTLSSAQQSEAVRGLWSRAQAMHDATPSLRTFVAPHGVFVPATLDDAMAAARHATVALGLSSPEESRLRRIVEGHFLSASDVPHTVNHGDLALMNALWDDRTGEVVSLLDVKFAVLGPVEVDLCRLVCEAQVTEDGELTELEAGSTATEIAGRHMDPVHGCVLINGAAVLDQLRDLDI